MTITASPQLAQVAGPVLAPGWGWNAVVFNPAHPGWVAIAAEGGLRGSPKSQSAIEVSRDGGQQWTSTAVPAVSGCLVDPSPQQIAWDGADLYAAGTAGVLRLLAGGSWSTLAGPLPGSCRGGPDVAGVRDLSVSASGRWAMAMTGPLIAGGGHWVETGGPGATPVVTTGLDAASVTATASRYYAWGAFLSAHQSLGASAPILASADGSTWSTFTSHQGPMQVSGGVLYQVRGMGTPQQTLWVSRNGGGSWTGRGPLPGAATGLSASDGVLLASPTVYPRATKRPLGYLSTDRGRTWIPVALPASPGSILAFAASPGALWIAWGQSGGSETLWEAPLPG